MIKVYWTILKYSDGTDAPVDPILAARKVDEGAEGKIGYFLIDKETEQVAKKEGLPQCKLLSADEAKRYKADSLVTTVNGRFSTIAR